MNLFKLVGSIFVDNEKANDSISKTDEKAENLAKKFVDGAVTAAKWGAGIATAAVGMATAAGAAIVKVTEDTREYRNEMGKLETAFETSNHSADTAKKTYQSLQSVLGETDQAVEAANHLAKLCQTEEELSTWTDICTGVYAEFGASLPVEGLAEAANETAKTGVVTGGLADALNWVGLTAEDLGLKLKANTDENKEWNEAVKNGAAAEDLFNMALSECSTEQERQALITETLNGLYSKSAEKYKENNKEVIEANKAQERLNETLAKIGEVSEPVVTKVKNLGTALLEKVVPAIAGFVGEIDENLPTVEELSNKIDEAYQWCSELGGYVADKLSPIFEDLKDGIGFVKEKFSDLTSEFDVTYDTMEVVKGAVDTLADSYSNLKKFVKSIPDAWKETVEWGKEHETSLTVAAIAIGTLTTAILSYNAAKIVKKVLDIAETAQIYLLIAAENEHTVTTAIATAATTAFGAAVAFLTSPITLVILAIGALIAVGVALYQNWDTVKAKCIELAEKVTTKFTEIKEKVSNKIEEMKQAVSDKIESIKTTALEKFNSIKDGIEEKINNAKDKVGEAIDKIKNFFNFEWSLPKLKLPHITISGEFSLKPPSTPDFSIDWYDKAMDRGMILNDPAIFGFNAKTNELLAGGETGSETVVGTKSLMQMIHEAVTFANGNSDERIVFLLENLLSWLTLGGFEEVMVEILTNHVRFIWKDREIARLVRNYA